MSAAMMLDRATGIATVQVSTEEAHAIGSALVDRLAAATAMVADDRDVRAVVLRGWGRYFSSGASPDALLSGDPAAAVYEYCAAIPRLLLAFPVPTIAAMAGHAVGGGLTIGLWCDIPLLAEESLYGANFMSLGFTPGMGTTVCLEEAVGGPLSRELLFTGRMMRGSELRQCGGSLAHAVFPRDQVEERADAIAREIAQVPRTSLELLKTTLAGRRRIRLEAALEEERRMHVSSFADAQTRDALLDRFADSLAPEGVA